MKRFLFFISVLFITFYSVAQTPDWQWAKADTNAKISLNPSYSRQITAASNDKVLWGVLQNRRMIYGQSVFGDYKLTVYDSSGTALTSTTITGTVALIDAQADDAGNWYILGQYYDTVTFPGGTQYTRNPLAATPESQYFLVRINTGTMPFAWARHIGVDDNSSVNAFTIANNAIYMAVDSGSSATLIRKFHLTTGGSTDLFRQTGQSITSSIAVDDIGNIYLAGSCAFTAINFNGHLGSSTSGYPVYLVRYKADGTYDWSYFMNDVTCVYRKITIANNNAIYYSGPVHDTLSIGPANFHRPAWVYDFLITKLDSSGNVHWGRQLKDTISGDANVDYIDHAAVSPDGSLNILAETRKYVDWGNNVNTNIHGFVSNVSVINISPAGVANWAKITNEDFSLAQHITANNYGIWITGNASDTNSLQFDGLSVPVPQSTYVPYLAKIKTNSTTAVKNVGNIEQVVTIAPNPATKEVSILGMENIKGNVSLAIVDMLGRTVFTKEYSPASGNEKLNVADYPRGLYFIEIKADSYKKVQKLILQ